jgi:hypothetical protein
MSPTVFKKKGYRFFFFSREETRMHVHIHCGSGEAKFWLEPQVELAKNYKLSQNQINQIRRIIEENYNEITKSWNSYFKS